MTKSLEQLHTQAEQIEENVLPNSNSAGLVGGTLRGVVEHLQKRVYGPVSGYVYCESIQDLPTEDLTPAEKKCGYLIEGHLYVYVGEDGDTLHGLYQDCGAIQGPQGPKGDKGDNGVSIGDNWTSFSTLAALDGKTNDQKEAMLPDGRVIHGITNGNTVNVSSLRSKTEVAIETDGTIGESTSSNNPTVSLYEVEEGQQVKITGYAPGQSSNCVLAAFYDADDVFVSYTTGGASSAAVTDYIMTVPAGAKYLRIFGNSNKYPALNIGSALYMTSEEGRVLAQKFEHSFAKRPVALYVGFGIDSDGSVASAASAGAAVYEYEVQNGTFFVSGYSPRTSSSMVAIATYDVNGSLVRTYKPKNGNAFEDYCIIVSSSEKKIRIFNTNTGPASLVYDDGSPYYKKEEIDKAPYVPIEHFTVDVECSNPNINSYTGVDIDTLPTAAVYHTDNAVLYLPTTYIQKGTPTKLVILCKQGASQVTPNTDMLSGMHIAEYLIYLGYAILAVDGMPDAWSTALSIDDTRVVGNYVAVRSVKAAYDYVIEKYNIDSTGCFIFGRSQGGHYAQNVVDLAGIPVLAVAEQSPACSMRYHQWDLAVSKTIGGITWSRVARLNIARIFGFPAVATNSELLALVYDSSKVAGYDPWTRNAENPYDGFVQNASGLWELPSNVTIEDITMKKYLKAPLKIWAAENDNRLGVDVMKVFVKAAKNAGCECDLRLYTTGAHDIHDEQTPFDTFMEKGKTYGLYPFAYEVAKWFSQFGGYIISQ